MRYKHYKKWLSFLLALSVSVIPLSACSKEQSKDHPAPFSYKLSFDENGVPIVLDQKGNALPLRKVDGPVGAKKILRVRTFSVIEVEGSHFILVTINGTTYQINIPD